MDDISRELGISKKTLYEYVKDKDELVSLIIDLEFEGRSACFTELYKTYKNAIDELYQALKIVNTILKEHSPTSVYDLRKYYPAEYKKMYTMRREKLMEHFITNLERGKEEGLYRSEIDETVIAKLQVLRAESTFDNDFFKTEELISPKIFAEIFEYHIRGIATEKGLKELKNVLVTLHNDYFETINK